MAPYLTIKLHWKPIGGTSLDGKIIIIKGRIEKWPRLEGNGGRPGAAAASGGAAAAAAGGSAADHHHHHRRDRQLLNGSAMNCKALDAAVDISILQLNSRRFKRIFFLIIN